MFELAQVDQELGAADSQGERVDPRGVAAAGESSQPERVVGQGSQEREHGLGRAREREAKLGRDRIGVAAIGPPGQVACPGVGLEQLERRSLGRVGGPRLGQQPPELGSQRRLELAHELVVEFAAAGRAEARLERAEIELERVDSVEPLGPAQLAAHAIEHGREPALVQPTQPLAQRLGERDLADFELDLDRVNAVRGHGLRE